MGAHNGNGKGNGKQPRAGDALLIVDVQNDFLPGGNLPVPRGDEVVPVLNRYIHVFHVKGLPIYATRDWHPPHHCSFQAQGGQWPQHCVAGSAGARFNSELHLPLSAVVISKATTAEADAYSGFQGTDLDGQLCSSGIKRLFIGGLATDYCVLNTVRDALQRGYKVLLLIDAIRAVEVQKGDGMRAVEEMNSLGAKSISVGNVSA